MKKAEERLYDWLKKSAGGLHTKDVEVVWLSAREIWQYVMRNFEPKEKKEL